MNFIASSHLLNAVSALARELAAFESTGRGRCAAAVKLRNAIRDIKKLLEVSTTWCPEVGNCDSSWHQFTSKAELDYAASQAPKLPGYIKHSIGGWKHPRQKEVFTLFVYLKEKP